MIAEVRSELQDTAILSTVDADLSHIPSLHNTMTGDPLNREEASSLDSNDNEAFDAWLDPPQDMCMAPDTENARPVSSPDKPGPVQSSRQSHGGLFATLELTIDNPAVNQFWRCLLGCFGVLAYCTVDVVVFLFQRNAAIWPGRLYAILFPRYHERCLSCSRVSQDLSTSPFSCQCRQIREQ